jgi:hypothetical protein
MSRRAPLRCNVDFPAALGTSYPFLLANFSFWQGNICAMPLPPLHLGNRSLAWSHRPTAGGGVASGRIMLTLTLLWLKGDATLCTMELVLGT